VPLISDEDRSALKARFESKLRDSVDIVVFIEDVGCRYCGETAQIAQELSQIDSRIEARVLKADQSHDEATRFGIKRVPATVVMGDVDYGIRFYGIPSGHEFSTYVEDVVNVSNRTSGLSPRTLENIRRVNEDVHIQIFVTPTCPYCPRMVLMAHQFAIASGNISTDMVESLEFPELSSKYGVLGVPKTVVNEKHEVVGLLPEPLFVEFILHSAGLVEKLSPALEKRLEQTRIEASMYSAYAHGHEHR